MYDLDLIHGLVGEVCDVRINLRPHEKDLLGLDLDVGSLTASPTKRLVDHDASIGKRAPLALGTGTYTYREIRLHWTSSRSSDKGSTFKP